MLHNLLNSIHVRSGVCVCVSRQYMVAIPAVLESAEMTKICASILQPNESLVMTVSLVHNETKVPIIQMQASPPEDIHTCIAFEVRTTKSECCKLTVSLQMCIRCLSVKES